MFPTLKEDKETHPPSPTQTTKHTGPRGGTFITPTSTITRMRPPIPPLAFAQSQNAYASSGLRQTRNYASWKPPGKAATRKQGMHIPKTQKT
ncbi:hypothetical protein Pyn_34983 [Prunus yedoensis var. nudiflora]|uniref:Uncharacterized protein n=1 Tax=Prunus yedoensis var. nudiflora TaxID=2094558 RepID=A0A314UN83_PRUYE|nr:hypothetical protein Pyn_34983 [Prunus yedoensis var. nudiflora]